MGLQLAKQLRGKQGPELDVESQEVGELLEWTENLNFDAYVKDWYQLSTSQGTKQFVPKFVNSDFNVLI